MNIIRAVYKSGESTYQGIKTKLFPVVKEVIDHYKDTKYNAQTRIVYNDMLLAIMNDLSSLSVDSNYVSFYILLRKR